MPQEYGLVELSFAEPARLLCREEDLDGHVFSAPFPLPHLAVATFSDAVDQVDLLGDSSLDLGKARICQCWDITVSRCRIASMCSDSCRP